MDDVAQIFGVALSAAKRDETAPQGADAIASPAPVPAVEPIDALSDPKVVTEPMLRLAQKVLEAWDRNVTERDTSGVSDRLQYDFDVHTQHFTMASIQAMMSQGIPEATGRKLYAPITFSKNRALQSLMDDMVNSVAEPIFHVEASPMPEVSKRVDALVDMDMTEKTAPLFAAIMRQAEDPNQPLPPQGEALLMRILTGMASVSRDKVLEAREKHAKIRAERMNRKVWDMMVEGGWERENAKCMEDFCVFGTAFMEGPVSRVVAANACEEDEDGTVRYERKNVLKQVFRRLNPLDCYPAPDAVEPSDGPFCIRVKYTPEELWRFCDKVDGGAGRDRGGEGWNAAVVRGILDRHPNGGVKIWTHPEDQARREAEMKSPQDVNDCTLEAVRCFLSVRGSDLAELGIVKDRNGKKIRMADYYHVEAVVLDGKTVYCSILDSRFPVPISKAVCYAVPGAFWGESLADKMKLAQTMLNNIAKSMFINLMTAGPMVWVESSRLHNRNGFKIAPWSLVEFDAPQYGQSQGAPIGFLQAPSIQRELVEAWSTWVNQADNDSGIPRFAEGQTGGQLGALRTSGGLSQMTDHMMRGAKSILRRYDNGIVRGSAQLCAEWILTYDDDMTLKGDVSIRCVGLFGRLARALRASERQQAMTLVGTSPYFQKIVPLEVVLSLLRPYLKELDADVSEMPGEEELAWLKQLAKVQQLSQAAQAEQNIAQQPQAGAQPQLEMQPGGVEERRAVA